MRKEQIVVAKPEHAEFIIRAQLNMAMQTEKMQLDEKIVSGAVHYFISLSSEGKKSAGGVYLVKTVDGVAVGSLLLTFESEKKWWIQSVYVIESARRQGHFTSLFKEAVRMATQNKAESIKLYAQSTNEQAKKTYFKLGMKITEDKFYSYDFVYGGSQLPKIYSNYLISQTTTSNQAIKAWLSNKTNILNGQAYHQNQQNQNCLLFQEYGETEAVVECFDEFSDWRFGVIKYVRQIYINETADEQERTQIIRKICQSLIVYLVHHQQLKVAAVRLVYRGDVGKIFTDGHHEHYDILELPLPN